MRQTQPEQSGKEQNVSNQLEHPLQFSNPFDPLNRIDIQQWNWFYDNEEFQSHIERF